MTSGNVSSFAVARLTAAGLPDTAWSPSGSLTTPLGATGYATAIVPSANGFVVAGRRADASPGNALHRRAVTGSRPDRGRSQAIGLG